MTKTIRWSAAKYRDAVKGRVQDGIVGLRSVAYGFDASEGFDLRRVSTWTPAQRRKVREASRLAMELTQQPKRIVRARGENLEKLQRAFHGRRTPRLKVAFVPDVFPEALQPGLKRPAPKITIHAHDIAIQHRDFGRILVPFDKVALATDPQKEVARAMRVFPQDVKDFAIQCERNITLATHGKQTTAREVLKLMERYNGVDPIPRGSKNAGANPERHKWDLWLVGVIGYRFDPSADENAIVRRVTEGMKQAATLRKRRNKYLKGKNGKASKDRGR